MCDPTVLAIGSFALKTASNIGAAKAQNRSSAVNEAEARAAETRSINDINLRQIQEQQATSQQLEVTARQTTSAVSAARLSAGEAGVQGASVDALMNTIGAEGATAAQDIKLNQTNTLSQLERQKAGISAEATSRVNSVPKANPFAVALHIAGDGLGLATQFAGRETPSAGPAREASVSTFGDGHRITGSFNSGFIPSSLRLRPR